ncbi:MAG: phosphatidate cytidylyltransferase [Peptoniphilaceae bacterium]|nr:phosphatidate cytidylyltransferase [Peptoniphilaceae bacterium]MDY6085550.1 phosphatidate cytidylyltransferase [Peptoniphilaceae bacterium]
MKQLIERTIIGVILLVVNLGVVLSGSRTLLFCFFVLLSSVAIWELFACLDPENKGRNRALTIIANFFFQYAAYRGVTEWLLASAIVFYIYLFMLSVIHPYREFEELFLTLFITIYITYFTSFVYLFPDRQQHYLLLVYAVSWGSDTFAYLSGLLFGKTPLTAISPKKTKEGAGGGILGSIFLCTLLREFAMPEIPKMVMVLIAVFGSISAQMGDLFASRLKRKMGIKDFGTIFRAHGGVMDRYDSFQFALPVVWLSYRLITNVI